MKKTEQKTEIIERAYTNAKSKQMANSQVARFGPLPSLKDITKHRDFQKILNAQDDVMGHVKDERTDDKEPEFNQRSKESPILIKPLENQIFQPVRIVNKFSLNIKELEKIQATDNLANHHDDNEQGPLSIELRDSNPVLNARPSPGSKIIEIDDFIDSPFKAKLLLKSPSQFEFRQIEKDGSFKSDSSKIVIKNSLTGTDTRSLYKELVNTNVN